MSARQYNRQSWIDPRIEVRLSPTEGDGMFAREPIKVGEVVTVWGGVLFTEAEIRAGKAKQHTLAAINEGLYLAGLPDDPDSPDDFMNHSCDPNVWMRDEVTLVARRDIAIGEELTADYAMWEADPNWVLQNPCNCGTSFCRKTITGQDWKLQDLQRRYGNHFSPFINRRIINLTSHAERKHTSQ